MNFTTMSMVRQVKTKHARSVHRINHKSCIPQVLAVQHPSSQTSKYNDDPHTNLEKCFQINLLLIVNKTEQYDGHVNSFNSI
jgi:hypothetical protein